jgi:hypothetical protein
VKDSEAVLHANKGFREYGVEVYKDGVNLNDRGGNSGCGSAQPREGSPGVGEEDGLDGMQVQERELGRLAAPFALC